MAKKGSGKMSDTLTHAHPKSETQYTYVRKTSNSAQSRRIPSRTGSGKSEVKYSGNRKPAQIDGSGRKKSSSKITYNGNKTSGWVTVNGRHIFLG